MNDPCRRYEHGNVFLPNNISEVHHFQNGQDRGKCELMSRTVFPSIVLPSPTAPITIQAAYAIVATLVPADVYVAIAIECKWHPYKGLREQMETEVRIYANTAPFLSISAGAATLDAAVKAFIAACQPSALPEEVDALITEVTTQSVSDVVSNAFVSAQPHAFQEKCGECNAEYASSDHNSANTDRLNRHEFVPTGRCFFCNEVKDDPIHTKEIS